MKTHILDHDDVVACPVQLFKYNNDFYFNIDSVEDIVHQLLDFLEEGSECGPFCFVSPLYQVELAPPWRHAHAKARHAPRNEKEMNTNEMNAPGGGSRFVRLRKPDPLRDHVVLRLEQHEPTMRGELVVMVLSTFGLGD